MKPKVRVLVVGAGPAGLAAAARLLERGQGSVEVKIVHAGETLGGKAASVEREGGFVDEHGWHMVVGFYTRMRALMARAGVDANRELVSMRGQSHCYEPFDGRVHTLGSEGGRLGVAASYAAYDGLPFDDRANFGRVMAEAFSIALSGEDLRRHDDICFDTWAVEHGLRPHVVRYSIFHFLRIAYFNFPEQISAYHILETLKRVSTSEEAELFVARGGLTDRIWKPVASYLRRLGAEIVPRVGVLDWIYDGDRIVALRTATTRGEPGALSPRAAPSGDLDVEPGSETRLEGFDYVLSTLPLAVVQRMNRTDARMWRSSYFGRLERPRSAATCGLTIVTERAVCKHFPGPLHGFPSPFNFVVNMKPYWSTYAADPKVGSVLVFGGQVAGFESWSDEEILAFTLESYAKASEVGDITKAGIVKVEMHRNQAPWERLFLSEPGVEQFRPGARTPFRNLFFAGDWVRNSVSVISMEGAIASGEEAADELLARIHEA